MRPQLHRARLGVGCAALAAVAVAVALGATHPSPGEAAAESGRTDPTAGRTIWLRDCAVCHRPDGSGSEKAPDIRSSGTAMVDFMVSTGRMPLETPDAPATRHPARYSAAQIRSLVAYTATFVHGPRVPEVAVSADRTSPGGVLYRQNCAACHQAAGGGGALAFGDVAPSLAHATPVQVVEAMRTGPGAMPLFDGTSISAEQADQIASYVQELRHPENPGGADLGHLGPVPEGLVAWIVGLGALLLVTRWLGTRHQDAHRT